MSAPLAECPGAANLRRARARDLDRLVELYGRMAEHHAAAGLRFALRRGGADRLRAHLADRVRAAEACVWVAEEDGDLLGLCVAVLTRRPAFFEETESVEVEGLYVRPERRRRGLARGLAEAALADLDPAGERGVQLGVARGNREGQAFWSALGFAPAMDVLERRR